MNAEDRQRLPTTTAKMQSLLYCLLVVLLMTVAVRLCNANLRLWFYTLYPPDRTTLCGITKPSQVIGYTGDHQHCVRACVYYQTCVGYNYYHNTSRCELFDLDPAFFVRDEKCYYYHVSYI